MGKKNIVTTCVYVHFLLGDRSNRFSPIIYFSWATPPTFTSDNCIKLEPSANYNWSAAVCERAIRHFLCSKSREIFIIKVRQHIKT